jgi:DNA-directed RNA polymerase subunit alpha
MLDISYTSVSTKDLAPNKGLIIMSPLPPGYGMTLGNAFRRILLSSMPGAAVTTIKVKNAPHEFSTIPGVKESVIDIILNIKLLRFKKFTTEPVNAKLSVKKDGEVTASEIKYPSSVELVNPDLVLAHLDNKKAELEIEFTIESGYGYVPSTVREDDLEPNSIAIDAHFSPVSKVRYEIENVRKGSETNLDKLTFEIETDGTVSPEDVLSFTSRTLCSYSKLLDFDVPAPKSVPEPGQAALEDEEDEEEEQQKYTPVEQLKLSPRSENALINNDIGSIEELITKTEQQLLNLKGFGKKALTEVKEKLDTLKLTLAE